MKRTKTTTLRFIQHIFEKVFQTIWLVIFPMVTKLSKNSALLKTTLSWTFLELNRVTKFTDSITVKELSRALWVNLLFSAEDFRIFLSFRWFCVFATRLFISDFYKYKNISRASRLKFLLFENMLHVSWCRNFLFILSFNFALYFYQKNFNFFTFLFFRNLILNLKKDLFLT